VIAGAGVAGTSARRVAAASDVFVGFTTYHPESMDALLYEAFTRFGLTVSDKFIARLSAGKDRSDAIDAGVKIIEHHGFDDPRDLVISLELYTLAAREPAYRSPIDGWMFRCRDALSEHFDVIYRALLAATRLEPSIMPRAA
jgi:DNA-binding transcriptional regulator YbjK